MGGRASGLGRASWSALATKLSRALLPASKRTLSRSLPVQCDCGLYILDGRRSPAETNCPTTSSLSWFHSPVTHSYHHSLASYTCYLVSVTRGKSVGHRLEWSCLQSISCLPRFSVSACSLLSHSATMSALYQAWDGRQLYRRSPQEGKVSLG